MPNKKDTPLPTYGIPDLKNHIQIQESDISNNK